VPLSRDIERRCIAAKLDGAFRVHLRRTVVERKVRRVDRQHALGEVAAGCDVQIPAVELGDPDVAGDADAIGVGLHVERDVAQRERRLLEERIQRKRRSVDVAGDVPSIVGMGVHRRRRRLLRLQQLCGDFQPVEGAVGLAVEREHRTVAHLQVSGRVRSH
jgi:hypothetical protein